MSSDFIRIKQMAGELKISHKKRDFGLTVSTEELIVQKPHVNYHVRLEDIISIVPFRNARSRPFQFASEKSSGSEYTSLAFDTPQYRFHVRQAFLHNRSGIFRLGRTELILPVIEEVLRAISQYGGMQSI